MVRADLIKLRSWIFPIPTFHIGVGDETMQCKKSSNGVQVHQVLGCNQFHEFCVTDVGVGRVGFT